jgi:hypothetical protein
MLDPDEVEVWCGDCNCKLYNEYIGHVHVNPVRCPTPEKCQEEREERWPRLHPKDYWSRK